MFVGLTMQLDTDVNHKKSENADRFHDMFHDVCLFGRRRVQGTKMKPRPLSHCPKDCGEQERLPQGGPSFGPFVGALGLR
jgi:hypothetical protein